MTYNVYDMGNMGVKRSVRTSVIIPPTSILPRSLFCTLKFEFTKKYVLPLITSLVLAIAGVYCINLDTYFKLDVPTNSIQVTNNIKCKEFFHVLLLKVSIDLDVLQIFEVFYIKFPVSFSMHFGNRYENVNPI